MAIPPIHVPAWWQLQSGDRRWAVGGGAALGLLVLVGVVAWHAQAAAMAMAARALAEAQSQQLEAGQRAMQMAAARGEEPQPWWARLASAPVNSRERSSPEQLSADALALASKVGVRVQRLSMSPQLHDSAAVYRRTVVQVELKGAYADVKRWLSALLARRPSVLALRSMDLRRADVAMGGVADSGIEATVELRFFEPAAANPASPQVDKP